MATIPARPGNLRHTAQEIERATGLRIQIIGGTLPMSPPRRGKHARTVRELRERIGSRLPSDAGVYESVSIALPDDEDDYATADLLVLPVGWEQEDDRPAEPRDVALAVEVIPGPSRISHSAARTDWYAAADVTLLLALDPRNGTWTLHTHPRDGAYQGVLLGEYGEPVPLPAPLPAELDTSGLPLYAPRR
ncbi:Uma2 family endonuclease [Kitasatospora sp. NPDC056783]|uniref:Uma2 family endonuclease n=1 Tax=Kitasatospora sp. NPDC056783 TaxID=3345943 RepID=UPI0036B790BA